MSFFIHEVAPKRAVVVSLTRESIRSWSKSLVVFCRRSSYRRPFFLEKCVAVSLDSDSVSMNKSWLVGCLVSILQ